jgi:hypothetical protein
VPQAAEGLDLAGVAPGSRDRLLGIIKGRCVNGRTGAAWQRAVVRALEGRGHDRRTALRVMSARYAEMSLTDLPVHQWSIG